MMTVTDALKSADLSAIRSFPKADFHNHFVLGGNREYLLKKTGYEIDPISKPLTSMLSCPSLSAMAKAEKPISINKDLTG